MQSQCSLIYLKSVQTKRASKGKAKHPLRGPKPLLRPWNAIHLQSSTRSLWLEASVTALETSRAVLYSAGILINLRSRYFSLPCINQRLELIDDEFSAMAESQFLPFFIRRPPKSIFSQFLHFVGRRQTVFIVFHVSAAADGLFSLFFAFRRSTMSVFSQFLHFAYERRMIFSVFHSSEGWEMQPAAFFGFPKRRKADFRCFSCFPMLG